jgi:hypothetical protein
MKSAVAGLRFDQCSGHEQRIAHALHDYARNWFVSRTAGVDRR